MKNLTAVLFCLVTLVASLASAQNTPVPCSAYNVDCISVTVPISTTMLKFQDKNGKLTIQSGLFALYTPYGKVHDIFYNPNADEKQMRKDFLKLLKDKVPATAELYYNPISPTIDENAVPILKKPKKVSLKAMGFPAGIPGGKPPKPGATMGTIVKFKYTLPEGARGYIVGRINTDDARFSGFPLEGDMDVYWAHQDFLTR